MIKQDQLTVDIWSVSKSPLRNEILILALETGSGLKARVDSSDLSVRVRGFRKLQDPDAVTIVH